MFHADIFSSRLSENSLLFAQLPGRYLVLAKSLRHFNCLVSISLFSFRRMFSYSLYLFLCHFASVRFCVCLIANSSIVWFSIFLFRAEFLTWQKGSGGCLTKSSIDSQKNLADNLHLYICFDPNQGLIRIKTWQKGSGGCLTKSSIDSQKNLADSLYLYIF